MLVLAVRRVGSARSNSDRRAARRAWAANRASGFVRLSTQHTLPRHSTVMSWPGSTLLMSTSTGAPAALARAEGSNDMTNGTVAAATPTPPTTPLAVIRKRRFLFSSGLIKASAIPCFRHPQEARKPKSSSCRRPAAAPFAQVRVAKPCQLYGIGTPPEVPERFAPEKRSESAGCATVQGSRQRPRCAARPPRLYTHTMLRKFWLLFAQACTLCLAALFVVATLRPDLLPRVNGPAGSVIVTQETATPVVGARVTSYADAAKKAMPAVVNIYTSKEVRSRNPLADDPLFRRYFPDFDKGASQRQTSLGSGVIVASGRLRAHQSSRDPGRRRHPARAVRRPPRDCARARHRSRVGPRRAQGGRGEPAGDDVRRPPITCRSATWCSRSAIPSGSATPSRSAS